ncbi:MAG: hypothetical protein ACXABV_05320 [Candidatus Thorarchaeota archaeon]
MAQTRTEQVAAELETEFYNNVLKDQEMKLVAAPANIDVPPELSLAAKTTDLRVYARIAAGVVGILALLTPLMLLPGLIVLVLPAEIYAVGWVYDRVLELRESGTKATFDNSQTGTASLDAAKDRGLFVTHRYASDPFDVLE